MDALGLYYCDSIHPIQSGHFGCADNSLGLDDLFDNIPEWATTKNQSSEQRSIGQSGYILSSSALTYWALYADAHDTRPHWGSLVRNQAMAVNAKRIISQHILGREENSIAILTSYA